jgi:hypothetical protein
MKIEEKLVGLNNSGLNEIHDAIQFVDGKLTCQLQSSTDGRKIMEWKR